MISRKLQLAAFSSLLWLFVGLTAFASQLDQTAVHEASHAVAALAQGGWVEDITIFANLGGECGCFHLGSRESSIIALAGYAGQRVILHTEDPYGASIDFDIGAQMVGGGLFYLLPRTEQLITRNQRAIMAIANELKRTRRMSGARALELFNQNTGIANGPLSQPAAQTAVEVSQVEDCPNAPLLTNRPLLDKPIAIAAVIGIAICLIGLFMGTVGAKSHQQTQRAGRMMDVRRPALTITHVRKHTDHRRSAILALSASKEQNETE